MDGLLSTGPTPSSLCWDMYDFLGICKDVKVIFDMLGMAVIFWSFIVLVRMNILGLVVYA